VEKKDLKKLHKKLLPILLPILFVFSTLACVLPVSPVPVPTQLPTIQNTPQQLPTQLPTDVDLDCETMETSGILGVVSASPDGGLNIRDLPLESGGKITSTISDGTVVEIFSSVGNNWNMVRFTDKNGKIMYGFAKMNYIIYK